MTIKVGDLVYISDKSCFYSGLSNNPINRIGVVKWVGLTVSVDWGDCENAYLESDLVVVTLGKSVLKDLLVAPFNPELTLESLYPERFISEFGCPKIPVHKVCKHCGELLLMEEYSKSKNSKDGYFPYCKCCVESLQTQHKQRYDSLYS